MIFDYDTSTCKRTISLHFKNRGLKRTVTFFGSHYPKKEVPSEVPTNNNNPPPSGRQRHIQNPHLLGDILLRWPTSWWFQPHWTILVKMDILPKFCHHVRKHNFRLLARSWLNYGDLSFRLGSLKMRGRIDATGTILPAGLWGRWFLVHD